MSRSNEVVLLELKRRAAALLSTGTMNQKEVAAAIGVSKQTLGYWIRKDDFQQMVIELAKDRTDTLMEGLQDAAVNAITRLRAHITATDKMGRPLWNIQMEAIKLALAYQLGQPTAKTESKELKLSGDLNKTVLQALNDPTIRRKLLPVPLPEPEPLDTTTTESRSSEGDGQSPTVPTYLREGAGDVLQRMSRGESMEQAVGSANGDVRP